MIAAKLVLTYADRKDDPISPGERLADRFESYHDHLRGVAYRIAGFVEPLTNLQDPIEPGFARSVVIDTSSDEVAPGALDLLVDELLKVPARAWREVFAGLLHHDDITEFERITAPTLFVWGDDDRLVGHDMQTLLARRIRGAVLLVYPGFGHTPRWEDRHASPSTWSPSSNDWARLNLEQPGSCRDEGTRRMSLPNAGDLAIATRS